MARYDRYRLKNALLEKGINTIQIIKIGTMNLAGVLVIISRYGTNANTPKRPPKTDAKITLNIGTFLEYTLHNSHRISASNAKFIKKETSAYTVTVPLSFVNIMKLL